MTSFEAGRFPSRGVMRLWTLSKACLSPWSILCVVGLAWVVIESGRPAPPITPERISPRLFPCEGITGTVFTVAWSYQSDLLAAVSWEDGSVILWNATLEREYPLEFPDELAKNTDGEARARDLAWSHDGMRLAVTLGKTVLVWDVAAGRVDRILTGHSHPVITLGFTPDGRGLRSGDTKGIVFYWDLETGASRSFAASINTGVTSSGAAWFSPDGRTIAATAPDGLVLLLDAESGNVLHRLKRPNQLVLSAAFSRDSRQVAVGSTEARVDVFNVADGTSRGNWVIPTSKATALAFTTDGRRLAVASGVDGLVTIWDVASGKKLHELDGAGRTRGLSFTGDGAFLVGGVSHAKIAVWAIPPKP